MRAKATTNDEPLEPLPVLGDDGTPVDPRADARELRAADVWRETLEVLTALRDTIAESTRVRAETPWAGSTSPTPSAPGHEHRVPGFSRMIALEPERLTSLPGWCARNTRRGHVVVARRVALAAPHPSGRGAWRWPGRLRRPWRPWWWRPVPIELVLWPHLGAWTRLALEPRRPVRTRRRYFRAGNRALDVLATRLDAELPRAP